MKTIKTAVKSTVQPLVEVRKNQMVTSSLQIAKLFGKEHRHVLRDIRALDCSAKFQASNFGLSFYINNLPNGGHKKLPMYYISRDGFTFLAMGFTGKEASKFKEEYINAFNTMEQKLREIERKTLGSGFVSLEMYEYQKKEAEYWFEYSKWGVGMLKKMSGRLGELLNDKSLIDHKEGN